MRPCIASYGKSPVGRVVLVVIEIKGIPWLNPSECSWAWGYMAPENRKLIHRGMVGGVGVLALALFKKLKKLEDRDAGRRIYHGQGFCFTGMPVGGWIWVGNGTTAAACCCRGWR